MGNWFGGREAIYEKLPDNHKDHICEVIAQKNWNLLQFSSVNVVILHAMFLYKINTIII